MINQSGSSCGPHRIVWAAQEKERDQLTREALADVDAGRVIDHEAVLTWAESLGTNRQQPVPCC